MRRSNASVFLILALVTFVVAVLRWFMRGWMQSLHVSDTVGSMLMSLTIVLLIGLVILFAREGRYAEGRYRSAAGWWIALAVWEQVLVIGGILLAGRTGASTYYSEMIAAHRDLPPVQHAISHAIALALLIPIGLLLGWPVYWVMKRGRGRTSTAKPADRIQNSE
ncbi:MAG TPA: hypothetical protein VGZ29_15525 [Terriglobia bacterium]|nr:hypothetical protein [Terriglobia bacterium]